MVDESGECVDDVVAAECLRRLEREAAGEDGKTREESARVVVEQVATPLDRSAESALAVGDVPHRARQQRQSVLESARRIAAGLSTEARAAASSIASGRPSSLRQSSAISGAAAAVRPLHEQRDRVVARQRRHGKDSLGRQAQRRAARCEDDDVGPRVENACDFRRGSEDVLEVVEHEQHAASRRAAARRSGR